MTLTDFLNFDSDTQWTYVTRYSSHCEVAERRTDTHVWTLLQVDGFYIEYAVNIDTCLDDGWNAFEASDSLLDQYLINVDITPLVARE